MAVRLAVNGVGPSVSKRSQIARIKRIRRKQPDFHASIGRYGAVRPLREQPKLNPRSVICVLSDNLLVHFGANMYTDEAWHFGSPPSPPTLGGTLGLRPAGKAMPPPGLGVGGPNASATIWLVIYAIVY